MLIISPSAINEKLRVSGTSLFFRSVIVPRISAPSMIVCCIIIIYFFVCLFKYFVCLFLLGWGKDLLIMNFNCFL